MDFSLEEQISWTVRNIEECNRKLRDLRTNPGELTDSDVGILMDHWIDCLDCFTTLLRGYVGELNEPSLKNKIRKFLTS